ncbi:hypothetical protein NPIL_573591, partial [Nephila pilipes]
MHGKLAEKYGNSLLEARADPNKKDDREEKLHYASCNNIRYLIKAGPDSNQQDSENSFALCCWLMTFVFSSFQFTFSFAHSSSNLLYTSLSSHLRFGYSLISITKSSGIFHTFPSLVIPFAFSISHLGIYCLVVARVILVFPFSGSYSGYRSWLLVRVLFVEDTLLSLLSLSIRKSPIDSWFPITSLCQLPPVSAFCRHEHRYPQNRHSAFTLISTSPVLLLQDHYLISLRTQPPSFHLNSLPVIEPTGPSVCTTFSGASFVSGIALTAASMPGVGILVGLGLMVGHGVYNDVSNIIEYKK